MELLTDSYGRRIKNLRISITDRCNFRCRYCMPAEGLEWLPRTEILTYEEITRIARVALEIGIEQIRITGGEPLVRRDVPELIRQLHSLPGLRSLSLTTNGTRLPQIAEELAEAGLTRINVSLDSLIPHKFFQITRRNALQNVLDGLESLEQYPAIHPIKVNAVAMRQFTEEEVIDFAELARRKPYIVRWIEFMPLDADQIWTKDDILAGKEILTILENHYGPLTPIVPDNHAETARRYSFPDGRGEVGFINPISEPFCAECDRIRLTAEGKIRTCLFSLEESDLRSILRNGGTDEELALAIRTAVRGKERKHFIGDTKFKRSSRTMSMIGG
jgi:cyclic pyranopterin phosphate synthase